MRPALIPGSFDPLTVGHMDVIARAAARFPRVYVAVMTNDMERYDPSAQAKTYLFTEEERRTMAEVACRPLRNVRVIAYGGLLADLFDILRASWIIKGVRNEADFAYEQKQALWNRRRNPRAETLYLPADPDLCGVSSTLVRARIERGDPIGDLVPPQVLRWIEEHPRPENNLRREG